MITTTIEGEGEYKITQTIENDAYYLYLSETDIKELFKQLVDLFDLN